MYVPPLARFWYWLFGGGPDPEKWEIVYQQPDLEAEMRELERDLKGRGLL